ncbi:uncharacterized protein LOC135215802 [Macrobrachium nipponense]|uniref:uncharacterized protein LOC135215802 n=1 Tax=Macrobrachium nipponense TaxID=159736 RepID=UPI0030C85B7C
MAGKRKFRDAWRNENFQSWLKPVEGNPERVSCRLCHKELKLNLTSIKRYNTSKIHLQNERAIDLVQLELEENQNDSSTPNEVNTATFLLACFIAENYLPFTTADKLVDLMNGMFPDSAIAQGLFMKRAKCTDVIRTMGKTVTNSLVKKLRTNKFSVIMDESTDVSTTKSCAVIVRFYDSHEQKITTAMLDLVNVYDSNNVQGFPGENLCTLLIDMLTKYDIPLGNFIGFVADGTSNIMGEYNSLCSRLKILSPVLTVFNCICHSIDLCVSEAAKPLPRHCEDLLRRQYIYMFLHIVQKGSMP